MSERPSAGHARSAAAAFGEQADNYSRARAEIPSLDEFDEVDQRRVAARAAATLARAAMARLTRISEIATAT